MRLALTGYISAAMLTLSACTSMTPSESGALSGAAIGGVAGAVLGDDEAALAGAAVGAAAGWYLGCRQEGRCGAVSNRREAYWRNFYRPRVGRSDRRPAGHHQCVGSSRDLCFKRRR